MLHSILSLFAVVITLTSSNRLLLQQQPQFVPIPTGGPVAPQAVTAAAVPPPPPAGTAATAAPGAGAATTAAAPPPVVPVVPVVPPAATTAAPPSVTYYDPNRYNNQYTIPGSGFAQPKLECKMRGNPMNPQSCAGKTMPFNNVNENFEVMCSAFEACTGAQMTFTWDSYASPQMETFKKLSFSSDYAAAGGVFTFSSTGPQILLDEIKCAKNGACQDTQFIIGDGVVLEHGDFFCELNSCHGCTVRQGGPLAAPEPCWSYVDII